MKINLLLASAAVATCGCSTLNQSLELGASLGTVAGGLAQYTALQTAGTSPKLEDTFGAMSVGLGVGLLTSYLIHLSLQDDRDLKKQDTLMYFGDLPPSPFEIPNRTIKRQGGK